MSNFEFVNLEIALKELGRPSKALTEDQLTKRHANLLLTGFVLVDISTGARRIVESGVIRGIAFEDYTKLPLLFNV